MKSYYFRIIFFAFILFFGFFIITGTRTAEAATCTASVSGNWSATSTWGGGACDPGGYPGAGTSTDAVVINSGVTVTLDVSPTYPVGSLTVNAAAVANGITWSGSNVLTVTATTTITAPTAAVSATLAVGAGTFIANGSVVINGGGTANYIGLLSVSTGTVTFGNGLSFGGTAAQAQFKTTGVATINLTGTIGTGGTLTITSGTNLAATGTSSVAYASAITTWGALTINSGATLTLNAAAETFTGISIVNTATLSTTKTITDSGAGANALVCGNGGSATISGAGGAIAMTGASAQISSTGICNITSLNISGSVTNNGTTTIATTLAGSGTLTNGGTGTLNIGAGSVTPTLIATASGNTVNYTGAAQTCKAVQYYNLGFSGSGTKTCAPTSPILGNVSYGGGGAWTPAGAITINGNLAVSSGTMTFGAYTYLVNGTTSISGGTLTNSFGGSQTYIGTITLTGGTLSGASAGIVTSAGITNNGGTVSLTGTDTISTPSVVMSGSSPISISNIVVSNPGMITNNGTVIIVGMLSGNGSWTQGANSALNMSSCSQSSIITISTFIATASGNTVNHNVGAGLICADGILGQGSYTTNMANWPTGSINAQGFANNGLTSLALDAVSHRLFVSDTGFAPNNRILVFPLDSNNNITTTSADAVLGSCNFTTAGSDTVSSNTISSFDNITYDSINDRLFVSDSNNSRILAFDVTPGFQNCEGAEFELGQSSSTAFTSSIATTTQWGLNNPDDITYDASNTRLFVSDEDNNRVMAFNVPANATSGINGENALFELGQPSSTAFTSSIATTTQWGFNSLAGVTYDPVGQRLFIGDYYNNRVMTFNVSTSTPMSSLNGENALFELGQPSSTAFTSSIATTTQWGLSEPDDLIYDTTGNRLFVSDVRNNRVMIFDVSAIISTSSLDGENAMANIGQLTWNSTSTGASQNILGAGAECSDYDAADNLCYMYDSNNNRILRFNFIHIANTSLPASTVSAAYSQPITVTSTQGTSQTYSIFSGSLPPGLSLGTSTGIISGTPTVATTTSVTIQANDNFASGSTFFDLATFTMQANSSDDSLSNLAINGASVSGFTSSTLLYNIVLPYGTISAPIVTATTNDPNAIDTITQASSPTGSATVVVTAQDGASTETYTVNFSVAPPVTSSSAPIVSSGGGSAYDLSVNGGATSTVAANVTLSLYGTEAYTVEVSKISTFAGATWIPYVTTMPWTLVSNLGTQTIYARFKSVGGTVVGSAQASIDLVSPVAATSHPSASSGQVTTGTGQNETQPNALGGKTSPITSSIFTRDLQLGISGADVRQLQQFLISQNSGSAARKLAAHGTTNYFGILTQNALIEFQKKKGIKPAIGYFGPKTRTYMNAQN